MATLEEILSGKGEQKKGKTLEELKGLSQPMPAIPTPSASQPQYVAQPRKGFFKSAGSFINEVGKDMAKLPASMGVGVYRAGQEAKNMGNLLYRPLVGQDWRKYVKEVDHEAPVNLPWVGDVKALGDSKRPGRNLMAGFGAGLELASYIPIARGVGTLAQTGWRGAAMAGTKLGLREGLTSGAMYGVGRELWDNPNATPGSVATSGAIATAAGGAGGAAFGAVLPMAGIVARSAWNKFRPGSGSRHILTDIAVNDMEKGYQEIARQYAPTRKYLEHTSAVTAAKNASGTVGSTPMRRLSEAGIIPNIDGTQFATEVQVAQLRESIPYLRQTLREALSEIDSAAPGGMIRLSDMEEAALKAARSQRNVAGGSSEKMVRAIRQEFAAYRRAFGESISLLDADEIRMRRWENAFGKKALTRADDLRNNIDYTIGSAARSAIEDVGVRFNNPFVSQLNREIGDLLESATFLKMLNGRAVAYGKMGTHMLRLIGSVAGSSHGVLGALGGAVGMDYVASILRNASVAGPVKRALLNNLRKQAANETPEVARQMLAWIAQQEKERSLRLALPEGARAMPAPRGSDGIRIVPAKKTFGRDVQTGKYKVAYTSEPAKGYSQGNRPSTTREYNNQTTTPVSKYSIDGIVPRNTSKVKPAGGMQGVVPRKRGIVSREIDEGINPKIDENIRIRNLDSVAWGRRPNIATQPARDFIQGIRKVLDSLPDVPVSVIRRTNLKTEADNVFNKFYELSGDTPEETAAWTVIKRYLFTGKGEGKKSSGLPTSFSKTDVVKSIEFIKDINREYRVRGIAEDINPVRNVGEVISNRVMPMRKRVGTTGKYIGSPNIHTPQQLSGLVRRLKDLAKKGEVGAQWYKKSADEIVRQLGKENAIKFLKLIAVYSNKTTPSQNYERALRAWLQYTAGGDIKGGAMGFMDRNAEKILRQGLDWDGIKTNSFYQNMLKYIDPENADLEAVTNDLWMMRAFGYGKKESGMTDAQHLFMTRTIQKIAKETGKSPDEVQAAIWVAIRSGDSKTVKNIMEDAAGFAGVARKLYTGLAWEAAPSKSSGLFPEMFNAPWEQRMEFHARIESRFYDENGRNIILDLVGLPQGEKLRAPGVWEGQVSPGTQFLVGVPRQTGNPYKIDPTAYKKLQLAAALMGKLTRQDGVGFGTMYAAKRLKDADAGVVNLGRVLTERESIALDKAMTEHFGAGSYAIVAEPRGARIIHFTDFTPDKFRASIKAAVNDTWKDDSLVYIDFGVKDGELVASKPHDYGANYREAIEGWRPSERERLLLQRVEDGIEADIREFSKKYGWTDGRKPGDEWDYPIGRGGGDVMPQKPNKPAPISEDVQSGSKESLNGLRVGDHVVMTQKNGMGQPEAGLVVGFKTNPDRVLLDTETKPLFGGNAYTFDKKNFTKTKLSAEQLARIESVRAEREATKKMPFGGFDPEIDGGAALQNGGAESINEMKVPGLRSSGEYSSRAVNKDVMRGVDGVTLKKGTKQLFGPEIQAHMDEFGDVFRPGADIIEYPNGRVFSDLTKEHGTLYLSEMAVSKDSRGKGLGSQYMRSVREYADKTQTPLEVYKILDSSKGFWKKMFPDAEWSSHGSSFRYTPKAVSATDNLLTEAKKYKTADEFVKKQPIVYHGSGVPLKKFDNKKGGAFFTDDQMNAEGYAGGENVYEGYLNLKKPLVIDAKGSFHRELDTQWGKTTQEIVGNVDKNKYDGVIFKNIKDSWIDDADVDTPSTIYYAFKPHDAFINESQLTDIWNKAHSTSKALPEQTDKMLDRIGFGISGKAEIARTYTPKQLEAKINYRAPVQKHADGKSVFVYGNRVPLNNLEQKVLGNIDIRSGRYYKYREITYRFGGRELKKTLSKEQPVAYFSPKHPETGRPYINMIDYSLRKQDVNAKTLGSSIQSFYHETGHAIDRLLDGNTPLVVKHADRVKPEVETLARERFNRAMRPSQEKYGLKQEHVDKLWYGKDVYMTEVDPVKYADRPRAKISAARSQVAYYKQHSEIFAEAYSMYRVNPERLKELSPNMYALLDEIVTKS